MRVREIMSHPVITVPPSLPVKHIAAILVEKRISGVPVVDENDCLLGIVTEADLVIADEQGDLHIPHYIELFGGVVFLEPLRRFEGRLKKALASTVADLMTEDPVTIEPDASVAEAGRLIVRRGHNRIPVVEHGRLVGVVTRVDVLEALTREA